MTAPRDTVLLLDVMDTLVYDPFFVEMPKFFGMTLKELLAAKHPTAWVEFEEAKIDEDEMLSRFFLDGRSFDRSRFLEMMRTHYRWLDGTEALLSRLKESGVPLYLLSNYPDWYRIIESKLGLSRFAGWDFVSARTGIRKPDPESYLGAARTLGVAPQQCLFVDDREHNCAGAREVGMPAHCFRSTAELEMELVRLGILG